MSLILPDSVREPPLKTERLAALRGRNIGARLEVLSDYKPAGDQPRATDPDTAGP